MKNIGFLLALLFFSGCASFIPGAEKPLPVNTSPKVTSNILFTYNETEVKDFDPITNSVTLHVDILHKNHGYSVEDLMKRLLFGPNSLKLELPAKEWFIVDGQVEEREETVFGNGEPAYQGEKTWAGVFKYKSMSGNELWLAVNEYSKAYFMKKKTGDFIDLACMFPDFKLINQYRPSYRLTLSCFPINQETSQTILKNPDTN